MEKVVILLLCGLSLHVPPVQCEVILEPDQPSLKVEISYQAVLKCCFTAERDHDFVWVKSSQRLNKTTNTQLIQKAMTYVKNLRHCGILTIKSATLDDTGFYRCLFNASKLFTHGTYLQVYKPLEKTIKVSESVKNGILAAEAILLLICVMLPSARLLFKSKNLRDLEKKKERREEENIYQGLNLDDCCPAYDQIERVQGHSPYEDVGNNQEDFQLEKP